MAMRELVFDIFAIDRASKTLSRIGGEAEVMGGKFGKVGAVVGAGLAATGVAVAAVGYEALKTSANMETAMNRLVSTAGESASGMKTVWAGIDQIAGQVGTSVTKLADAAYYVEGAGFHGADALKVLTAVAKGAKVEMADTTEVAKAIGGALADYNLKADKAATVTNAMLTAVGHGQTSFADFAGAFPKVGSRAAAANVTLNETLSAMSRMTRDGLPAAMAATYLGQTIGHLAYPTGAAVQVMKGLHISAIDVQRAITSGSGHGLGDAIEMLYKGITSHLTPSGLVAIEMFKKSKGGVTDYQKVLANLPPDMQTTVGALAAMSGGVKGFQGLLMLGNDGLKGYKDTLAAVNETTKKGGQDIEGFGRQQKSFNGELADAKGAWSGLLDTLGRALLPVATKVLDWFNKSLPAIEAWVGMVAKKASPAIQEFGNWFKNQLMPALDKAAKQIIPSLQDAWKTVSKSIGDNKSTWTTFGHFLTDTLIPALTLLAKVAIPAIATALAGMVLALRIAALQFQLFKQDATTMAVLILRTFSSLEAGWGGLLVALGQVPGFGWATAAGKAMLGAAADAGALAKSLTEIQSPPPIDIQVNAYGTSAIANAIIAGNAPLANSMIAANSYAGGGAYTTSATGGRSLRGGSMRASGGYVQAGEPYVVGENHPEVFIPQTNGYISPHRPTGMKAGGANGITIQHLEYHAGSQSPDSVAAALMWKFQHS